MEALFISPITLFLMALVTSVVGAAVGWYWKKRSEGTWKEDYRALEKSTAVLNKKAKKSEKDNNRLKKQLDTWKEKHRVEEEKYTTDLAELKETSATYQTSIQEKDKTIRQLELAGQNAKTSLERLEKAHAKLNAKYKAEMADLKEWRKNKDSLNAVRKDLKSRLKLAEEKNAKLSTTNAKLSKEIEENSAFVSKLRALKARNTKLTEDLKYWEKKHYDCHHELAQLKTKFEVIDARNQELELVNQNNNQAQQQMKEKVQQFKTRFVDINDKYHRLLDTSRN